MIRFGPSGIGGVREAPKILELYNKQGIKAAEIPFTYQIWMNNAEAKEIGEIAKEFDIKLSIHAPYWLNLASKEKDKRKATKKRILNCCERAHYMKANVVVFHCGYYQGRDKEEVYDMIKNGILDMQGTIKNNKWKVKLAPETAGKINVFGSLDEILRLVKEIKCGFCIDFAHIKAYSLGKLTYDEICKEVKKLVYIHAHFSGIEWTSKGERNHKITPGEEIKKLGLALKKNKIKDITIINESPDPFGDSLKLKKIFEELKI